MRDDEDTPVKPVTPPAPDTEEQLLTSVAGTSRNAGFYFRIVKL